MCSLFVCIKISNQCSSMVESHFKHTGERMEGYILSFVTMIKWTIEKRLDKWSSYQQGLTKYSVSETFAIQT